MVTVLMTAAVAPVRTTGNRTGKAITEARWQGSQDFGRVCFEFYGTEGGFRDAAAHGALVLTILSVDPIVATRHSAPAKVKISTLKCDTSVTWAAAKWRSSGFRAGVQPD